ncbi:MAG: hypothetical protein AAF928_18990, partial [Myxococcota bacterium]
MTERGSENLDPQDAREEAGSSLGRDAWRRLKRNRPSFWALVFLALFGAMSLFAPLLPIPSPIALSLRDEPAPPQWPWEDPIPLEKPLSPGLSMTENVANLWNDGWRHRSIVRFSVSASGRGGDSAAQAAKARVEEVCHGERTAIVAQRESEDGALEAFVAVPHLEDDAPRVNPREIGVSGRAVVWRYDARDEGSADPDWRIVHSLTLENERGEPFDASDVAGWSFEERGRSMKLFLARRTPVDGLASWIVEYRLREEIPGVKSAVLVAGVAIDGSEPVT